ncbi:MAG: hypothetical protein ACYCPA_01365 [Acidithiobacillus sp.]
MKFYPHTAEILLIGAMLWLLPVQSHAAPAVFRLHGEALQERVDTLWRLAWHMPGITTGPLEAQERVLIFFDPNCPFCARLWRELRPWRYVVTVHWVPVAFIRPSSVGLAAAMLMAHDPARTLAENENRYNFRSRTGGLLPVLTVPSRWVKVIGGNTNFWARNFGITPTLLFQGRKNIHDVMALPNTSQLGRWLNQDAIGQTIKGG